LVNVGEEAQKGNSVLKEAAFHLSNPSNEVKLFGFCGRQ
jgi:hypothetical protein